MFSYYIHTVAQAQIIENRKALLFGIVLVHTRGVLCWYGMCRVSVCVHVAVAEAAVIASV